MLSVRQLIGGPPGGRLCSGEAHENPKRELSARGHCHPGATAGTISPMMPCDDTSKSEPRYANGKGLPNCPVAGYSI